MKSRSAAAAALLATALAGCAGSSPEARVSAAVPRRPADAWTPPPVAVSTPAPAATLPGEAAGLLAGPRKVSLAEAVDVALSTSPVTRRSWLQARSAAADEHSVITF